jgi:hypothetical protein
VICALFISGCEITRGGGGPGSDNPHPAPEIVVEQPGPRPEDLDNKPSPGASMVMFFLILGQMFSDYGWVLAL